MFSEERDVVLWKDTGGDACEVELERSGEGIRHVDCSYWPATPRDPEEGGTDGIEEEETEDG